MDYTYYYESPLGGITVSGNGDALTGLWFDAQAHFASTLSDTYEYRELPVFHETARWLDLYFSGGSPRFTPPLLMIGTPFRKAVWEILLSIPYGETVTYGQIAASLAKKQGIARVSARAVGSAVGHNPISLIVPCHRVIGADGSLTGYAGGLDRKRALLMLESQNILPL